MVPRWSEPVLTQMENGTPKKLQQKKRSGGAIWRLRGILLPFMEVFSPILHKHFTATGGSVLNPPSRVSFSAAAQDG